jgi:exodeoxyribonuclease-3
VRVVSWNVNGLRAAWSKRFREHLRALAPDVLLLQEVRATPEQLPFRVPRGWRAEWHPAERLGYSGVACWSRLPVERLEVGCGGPDPEGRVLRLRVGGVELVSLYAPSGSAGPESQARKDRFLEDFERWLGPLLARRVPLLLAGDFNVVPTDDDIHDPRGNRDRSGNLPHERAWFARLLGAGLTDLVRDRSGPGKGPYTWWSNLGRARAEDRGWRIDHLLADATLAARVRGVAVHRAGGLDTSDHAPVVVDLDDGQEASDADRAAG